MANPVSTVFDPLAEDAIDQVRSASDEELLTMTAAIEELGRRVDAARVSAAAEVAHRSRRELEAEALSARKGCRNASELLQRLTGDSARTIENRIRLGKQLLPRPGLTSDLPPTFPIVAAALADGRLSVDKATAIVQALAPTLERAPADHVAIAEHALVDTAAEFTADEIRIQATVWQAAIDPDGIEPTEERAMAKRGLRLGRARDGLIPINGTLMPETAGTLARLFDAHLSPRTAPAFLSDEEHAAAEVERDPRTPDQQRHDVLAGLIDAASRSTDAPSIAGAPPTVLVTVRADDLRNERGAGYIDGIDVPISLKAVQQKICTGGTRNIVIDDNGRIIELGTPQRTFTANQRKAIAARDGGCIIPGCCMPAALTEVHHVTPDRDEGPTHTDNGVLLCWYHHRTIDSSGWRIRMIHGSPWIKAPPWIAPDAPWRPTTKSRTRIADLIDRRYSDLPPDLR